MSVDNEMLNYQINPPIVDPTNSDLVLILRQWK